MPAEGAMQTEVEAAPAAPRAERGGEVLLAGVRKAFGPVLALDGVSLHAARGPAGALPRRAVRRAGRPHARASAGLARGGAGPRAADRPPGHPRRRGGGDARGPRPPALAPAGARGAGPRRRARAPPLAD